MHTAHHHAHRHADTGHSRCRRRRISPSAPIPELAQTRPNLTQQRTAGRRLAIPASRRRPRRRPRIQRKTRQIRSTRAGRGHRPVQRRTRRVESQRRGLRRLQRQGIPVPARLGRRSDGNHQDPENLRQPADLPRHVTDRAGLRCRSPVRLLAAGRRGRHALRHHRAPRSRQRDDVHAARRDENRRLLLHRSDGGDARLRGRPHHRHQPGRHVATQDRARRGPSDADDVHAVRRQHAAPADIRASRADPDAGAGPVRPA